LIEINTERIENLPEDEPLSLRMKRYKSETNIISPPENNPSDSVPLL